MAFDFPASPSENQTFTPAGGPAYIYHAPAWELVTAAGGLAEAPTDGQHYARKGQDASWVVTVPVAGGTAYPASLVIAHGSALGAINNVAGLCYDAANGLIIENTAQCASMNRNASNGAVLNFAQAGTFCGSITVANSTSTAFNTSSDERLKEQAETFDAGSILDATNVYHFKWIGQEVWAYGVMAQEAQTVFPDAVTHDEEHDSFGVDYSKYVPLLLNEIKALRARVAALETAA